MDQYWWLAVLFLPLFPFSMFFVVLVNRLSHPWLRSLTFLLWPLLGVALLIAVDADTPRWLSYWALATSFLYAFRALVIRELNRWLSYIAVSSWAILWIVLTDNSLPDVMMFALGFALPMALMALLGGELKRRFSSSYAGLYGGIASSHPRLSAMLVFTLLAVIATPMFPGFFTMMSSIMAKMLMLPSVAIGLLLIWLLWSWSGILLLQGLVMGPKDENSALTADLALPQVSIYGMLLVLIGIYGLSFAVVF